MSGTGSSSTPSEPRAPTTAVPTPAPSEAAAIPAPSTSSSVDTSSSEQQAQPKPQPTASQRIYKVCKPILAGGITGGIETLILYPTEYVKTHLQLQGGMAAEAAKKAATASACASAGGPSPPIVGAIPNKPPVIVYTGMVDCYLKTVKSKGFFGLYQGMTPVLVGTIPKQATRWGVYEAATSSLCNFKRRVLLMNEKDCQKTKMSLAEVSACGLVAGALEACIAAVPMDTVKTRLIDDAKSPHPLFQNKSLPAAVSIMIRQEGIRGIYKGVGGTVMKQSVNQMVRFPVQQATMNVFCSPFMCGGNLDLGKRRRRNPFWNGFAGFIAGVASVFLSQPFDVVKTRLQSQTGSRYKGSVDCFRTIMREDGWKKMYSGCVPRCLRVGGNVALTFTLFPVVKTML